MIKSAMNSLQQKGVAQLLQIEEVRLNSSRRCGFSQSPHAQEASILEESGVFREETNVARARATVASPSLRACVGGGAYFSCFLAHFSILKVLIKFN